MKGKYCIICMNRSNCQANAIEKYGELCIYTFFLSASYVSRMNIKKMIRTLPIPYDNPCIIVLQYAKLKGRVGHL